MPQTTSGYAESAPTQSSKADKVYFSFSPSNAVPDPAIPAHAKIVSVFVSVYGNINTSTQHGILTADFGGQTLYQNGTSNEGVGGLEGEGCVYGFVTDFFESQNANAGKLKDSSTKISATIDGPLLLKKYDHSCRYNIIWTWVPSYKITWKNWDGTVLEEKYVPDDETPSYSGSTPTRASDVQCHYTFAAWTPSVGAITSDTTYTAQYSSTPRQYNVTCIAGGVGGGTITGYDAIAYDYGTKLTLVAEPLYDHIEFEKWSDTGETSPSRTIEVTGHMTFTAIFKYKTHDVTFLGENGVTVDTINVSHGDPVTPPTAPEKADTVQWDYYFSHWEDDKGNVWNASTVITSDTTYIARYGATAQTYTVRWFDGDGNCIETDEGVHYGDPPVYNGTTPTRTGNDEHRYEFSGWNWGVHKNGIAPNLGDKYIDITAEFNEIDKTYTVKWQYYDGEKFVVIETDEKVPYGNHPEYNGVKPKREDDEQYVYDFIGWSVEVIDPVTDGTDNFPDEGNELPTVKGDITYTAVFSATKQIYEIKVITLDTTGGGFYEYGTPLVLKAPEFVGYKFTHWNDGNTNAERNDITVTGTATYVANYERLPIPLKANIEQITGVYVVPDTDSFDTGDIVYVISGVVPEVTVKAERVDGWRFIVSNTIPENSYPLKRLYKNGTRVW